MAKVPDQIIRLVSRGLVEFSEKGYRQLFEGRYDEDDVRNAILFGTVVKKEKDETKAAKFKIHSHRSVFEGKAFILLRQNSPKGERKGIFYYNFS